MASKYKKLLAILASTYFGLSPSLCTTCIKIVKIHKLRFLLFYATFSLYTNNSCLVGNYFFMHIELTYYIPKSMSLYTKIVPFVPLKKGLNGVVKIICAKNTVCKWISLTDCIPCCTYIIIIYIQKGSLPSFSIDKM